VIGGLFRSEAQITELAAGDAQRLHQHRAELRRLLSKPIIEKPNTWRKQQRALPKSHFGEGLTYLENQWHSLIRFLRDPIVPLDNNEAERGMRGPVLGRKIHYGSRSEQGTIVAAMFYSLIESCKRIGLDPTIYLKIAVQRALDAPGTVTLPKDLLGELQAAAAD